ncbi:acyl-CoA thioesterase [Cnuibacter physcomitrellae]|uniref:acyl-CoA thioesterase n=1 Tax=Cnuibacter physcomitrellae TaxID=1619308 RepID=UPI0021761C7F|nr:thioesterase family protein [Cnuibacter physcomitrellae]MCS5498326.1 acyl-CoA thioesterase [Cnuibacter physcomitrellae]
MTADLWSLPREQAQQLRPDDFAVQTTVPTRWRDNDMYGHLNNVLYYEFFDTAINSWLATAEPGGRVTGTMFVAESSCRYHSELAFPAPVVVAHRVASLGNSSVTYELGVFGAPGGEIGPLAALGRWVHVHVDPVSHRPAPLPGAVRALLERARPPIDREGRGSE